MSTTSRLVSLVALGLAMAACDGGPPPDDAGPPVDAPGADADLPPACDAILVLEQRCALGGCHLPNNPRTSLVLTRESVRSGGAASRVIPGNPDASPLYLRMTSPTSGPLMPLGQSSPIPEAATIRQWILDGASTSCASLPPPPDVYDPNHLDPAAIFTCTTPTVDASPARVRRVERREWTHAVVKPLIGTWWGSTARDNPFATPESLGYSTYARGVTVDPSTLDLYFLVLPEAPAMWDTNDPAGGGDGFISGTRTVGVYNEPSLRCIHDDAMPDDACLDHYVDTLLRRGVLFREPTEGEHARLRALLVHTIEAEAGDVSQRRASLLHVGQAAFLMTGALFRSELGEPVAGDAAGRRRLTADEMALAVGHVLSSHPTGTPVPLDLPAGHPDADSPLGRQSLVRQAADDGTIFDRATLHTIFETYQAGVDPMRADLSGEEDDRDLPSRGEYWIAENLLQFFREWLGYDDAISAFKDTPGGTSRYGGPDRGGSIYDRTTGGFSNLQSSYYGYESTIVDQMDDTIARAVIESHESGNDVFEALLTTRMWRLPSTLVDTNGVPCTDEADCTDPDYGSCSPIGICANSISGSTTTMARVYGREDIPNTPEGRWVEMPAGERMGVLTHPAWLAAHGGNFEDDASAIRRGHWIREQLLCETVPGLEFVSVEARLVPSDPSLSARARLHTSVEDPATNPFSSTCMGCHALMNSLGYPFEIYNHAGFLRAYDHGPGATQVMPDGSSTLMLVPDAMLAGPVRDGVELSERLAGSRVARRCFIRHAFRYFMGRDETEGDACTLAAMESSLDADGSFFHMVETLVASDTFQMRSLEEVDR
ncbi:MAG: DUF1588 domain-containing protein [Sandaracinaceae bacterium]|nr:DUF1588 domain-containing protein [Sandaracinaceae bacterium]